MSRQRRDTLVLCCFSIGSAEKGQPEQGIDDEKSGGYIAHGGIFGTKDRQGIDQGVGNDAGDQRAALVKNHHEQEADGDGVSDLQQGRDQLGAVEQVDNVPHPESKCADNNRAPQVGFGHHPEEEAPEDDLLDEADVEHGQDVEDGLGGGEVEVDAAPKVDRDDGEQREEISVFPGLGGVHQSVISAAPQCKDQSDQRGGEECIDDSAAVILGPEVLHTEGIEHNVQDDEQNADESFVPFKEFFHVLSPLQIRKLLDCFIKFQYIHQLDYTIKRRKVNRAGQFFAN